MSKENRARLGVNLWENYCIIDMNMICYSHKKEGR